MLYPSGPVISALRLAEDYVNAVDCILQETPYHTFLTTVSNDFIGVESMSNGNPIRTDLRITIADGYRSYLSLRDGSDGYLYPPTVQEDGMQLFASQGVITDNTIMVGPLVFPYTLGIKSGGTDPAVFQQAVGTPINNIQYWIWLVGPGINNTAAGNYYDIKEVKIDAMNNINYYLVLKATENNPSVTIANIIN